MKLSLIHIATCCKNNLITDKKGITKFSILVMLFLFSSSLLYSQTIPTETTINSGFGIDSGVYSGNVLFPGPDSGLADDWFQGATGFGVIDETVDHTAALSVNNATIEVRMNPAIAPYTNDANGRQWIDAVFLRDQNSKGNNKDSNVFTGGSDKNVDNPNTWTIANASVPQKNDIIDVFGHLRRDVPVGGQVLGTEWAIVGASTRNANGDSHLDFEIFRGGIAIRNDSIITTTNLDATGGRTAYTFNGDGSTAQFGDAIVSVDYANGGANAIVKIYVWTELIGIPDSYFTTHNGLPFRSFEFAGENHSGGNGAGNYGYAQIQQRTDIPGLASAFYSQVNDGAPVVAGPWQTIGTGGALSTEYHQTTFAELAINATALGLDSGSSGTGCAGSLGDVIVKTRSSDSFTAELKDLAGPFSLGAPPEVSVELTGDTELDCNITSVTLTAAPSPNTFTYIYEWYKDDVLINGAITNQYAATEGGTYKVIATIENPGLGACVAEGEIIVTQDTTPPSLDTSDTSICKSDSVDISTLVNINNGDVTTYHTTQDDADNNVNPLGNTLVSPVIDTIYYVRSVDSNNGCFSVSPITITVHPVTPDEPISGKVCEGDTFTFEGAEYAVGVHNIPRLDANQCPYDTVLTVTAYPIVEVNIQSVEVLCSTDDPIQLVGSPDAPGTGVYTGTGVSATGLFDPGVAGEGVHEITYTYTSENQCISDVKIVITVENCVNYCSYTQGFYGNEGGLGCAPEIAERHNAQYMMEMALNNVGGQVYFGSYPARYFEITSADVEGNNAQIFDWLPGGGPAKVLNPGENTYQGRIRNILLAQTVTLFFNTELNEVIGDWELQAEFYTSALIECGQEEGYYETETFTISQSVIDYLNANYGGATVSTLMELANDVLGGVVTDISASAVNGAVDAINRGFDECRVLRNEPNSDEDSHPDSSDNCMYTPNEDQLDNDGDGIGDVCDNDDDNDGSIDENDCMPFDATIYPGATEICGNGIDENCNGDADDVCPPIIEPVGFTTYPVPFDEDIYIKYNYPYSTSVKVEIFDTKGALVTVKTDKAYVKNTDGEIHIDLSRTANQSFFIKVSTNRGVGTKQVISSSPRRRKGY
ncbi:MAG: hypothetical protein COA67_07445 [Lutibacter sp.]|nr:MAG: hypothetical protein COA67_07445 [Lutibacter sp.]